MELSLKHQNVLNLDIPKTLPCKDGLQTIQTFSLAILIQKLITARILVKGWYVYAASICFICYDLRLAKWWIEPQLSTSHKALMSRQLGKRIQKMENPNRPSTFFLGIRCFTSHQRGAKKGSKRPARLGPTIPRPGLGLGGGTALMVEAASADIE